MLVRRGSKVNVDHPLKYRLLQTGVILLNPKYPHNVGTAVRMCSCYDVMWLVITGGRVQIDDTVERLPREERMRAYEDVNLIKHDRPFDLFDPKMVPVCVEFTDQVEDLVDFEHPKTRSTSSAPRTEGSIRPREDSVSGS